MELSPDAVPLVESIRPAIEFNSARTNTHVSQDAAAISEPGEPCSDTALRVLAVLTGVWIAQEGSGCRPDYGEHEDDCQHREEWTRFTLRGLARETFGREDGTAVAQVASALEELESKGSRVLLYDPETSTCCRQVAALGSFRRRERPPSDTDPGVGAIEAKCRWSWSVPIHERLLAGGYQRLPVDIVRKLRGSDWHVWMNVLCHPGVAALAPGGRFEIGVGLHSKFELRRLGLAGLNRPAKVKAALERAARRGNAIQDRYRLDVVPAASGGLKFRITRGPADTRPRDPGAWTPEPKRATSRTRVRDSEDAIPFKSGDVDGFRDIERHEAESTDVSPEPDGSLRSPDEPGQSASAQGSSRGKAQPGARRAEAVRRADAIEELLLASPLDWKPASERQRARIEACEARAISVGCPLDEHLEVVEQGIREYVGHFEEGEWGSHREADPLTDLFFHDDLFHPRGGRSPYAAAAEDPISTAWGYATTAPLAREVAAELRAIADRGAVQGQGGEVAVANWITDVSGAAPGAILDHVREEAVIVERLE